jgi:hypothetical protein
LPGDALRALELEQQLEVLGKDRIVLGEGVPEERERLRVRAAARDV